MAIDSTLQHEYDSFGPWLLEIKQAQDIPLVFVDYFQLTDEILLALKVPRPIERRDARPGQVLYDGIVCLYDREVKILHLEQQQVLVESVCYKDIVTIQDVRDLLMGELRIQTDHRSYSIPYNMVSQEMVDQVVHILRKKYICSDILIKLEDESFPNVELPLLFKNALNKLRANEKLSLLAYQPNMVLEGNSSDDYERFENIYNNYTLYCSLFLSAEREIVVISSNKPVKRRIEVDNSYILSYIPYSQLRDMQIEKDRRFIGLRHLQLKFGHQNLEFMLDQNTTRKIRVHVLDRVH
ncbi:hypothetical protein [Gynuella sp.]|uniref:hypothetical protein n=1 Tax=Gynuella sp. TaxID=2969146 RepID=UPI003D1183A6